MRVAVCILGSLAVGCATYLLGAVLWSIYDPFGAGKVLLFTIPIAIAAMAAPALLAVVGMMNLCNWSFPRRLARRRTDARAIKAPDEAIDLEELPVAA